MPRLLLAALMLTLVAAALAAGPVPLGPPRARAATCAGYADQATAQRAADTRDADNDGIYCVISPH